MSAPISREAAFSSPSTRTTMRCESTKSTVPHRRAVRIVVLEEGDERGGHRDELLRRDVDELDLVARRQDEVAGLPGIDALLDEFAVVVDLRVGLRDDVLVLFPRR